VTASEEDDSSDGGGGHFHAPASEGPDASSSTTGAATANEAEGRERGGGGSGGGGGDGGGDGDGDLQEGASDRDGGARGATTRDMTSRPVVLPPLRAFTGVAPTGTDQAHAHRRRSSLRRQSQPRQEGHSADGGRRGSNSRRRRRRVSILGGDIPSPPPPVSATGAAGAATAAADAVGPPQPARHETQRAGSVHSSGGDLGMQAPLLSHRSGFGAPSPRGHPAPHTVAGTSAAGLYHVEHAEDECAPRLATSPLEEDLLQLKPSDPRSVFQAASFVSMVPYVGHALRCCGVVALRLRGVCGCLAVQVMQFTWRRGIVVTACAESCASFASRCDCTSRC